MPILISAATPNKSNARFNFKFFYIVFCTTYKTYEQQAIRGLSRLSIIHVWNKHITIPDITDHDFW